MAMQPIETEFLLKKSFNVFGPGMAMQPIVFEQYYAGWKDEQDLENHLLIILLIF